MVPLIVIACLFVGLPSIVFGQQQSAGQTQVTIVDLTQELHEDIPLFPIYNALRRNVSYFGKLEEQGFRVKHEEICMATHYGTHMDAPCHFDQSKWCLESIPIERFVLVPAAVFDMRKKIFVNSSLIEPDSQLTIEDIEDWEKQYGRIPEHSLLLILTGFGAYWNEPSVYFGTDTKNHHNHRHPGLSPKAAEWLVRERPTIYGVGIDAASIDYGKSRKFEAHQHLQSHNVYILENLVNLERLPATGALVNVGAIKLAREASGVPVRVFATVYSKN